jgi:hypothetical protein
VSAILGSAGVSPASTIWYSLCRKSPKPQIIDEQVSGYYLAIEMANTADRFTVVLDPADRSELRTLSVADFAACLRTLAAWANLRKYRKQARGPKKPASKRVHNPRQPHVSVARVLAEREKSCTP